MELTTQTGSGILYLYGTNTYTGGTVLNGGTISLWSAGALGTSGTISFGGGTLQATTANTTDYSPRFSSASNQAYSVDTAGENLTWAGELTSSGGTLKVFDSEEFGSLTLTGLDNYSRLHHPRRLSQRFLLGDRVAHLGSNGSNEPHPLYGRRDGQQRRHGDIGVHGHEQL